MNLHSGARTCPRSRELLVQRVRRDGWSVTEAAAAAGISRTTAYKWLHRFAQDGAAGLLDRTSRPHRCPGRTSAKRVEVILELRRCRMTERQIAKRLRMPQRTVSRILQRAGLSRRRDLDPPEPPRRYEYEEPGGLVHLDIKKLGKFGRPGHRVTGSRIGRRPDRGRGWEFVHVAIDDHSRVAYVEILDDEKKATCTAFLRRAVAWYRERGIRVRRILTDNGGGYRSYPFRDAMAELGIRHIFTKPYTPRTNGKAERFIQTLLREWAYERPYRRSSDRRRRLPGYVRHYNTKRGHGSLGGEPPITRLRGAV
jgi:transposase InsO family protein